MLTYQFSSFVWIHILQYGQAQFTLSLISKANNIYVANTHKQRRLTQVALFLASIAAGTRLIWLVNRAPWYVTIRQVK